MRRYFTEYDNKQVPVIKGAFGGKSGGGGQGFTEDPNSLFSTDILFVLTALGEGPVYRINPNGPQDIEITENTINDLIKLDGDGSENTDIFKTLHATGTTTQAVLPKFGSQTIVPQQFTSPVSLKKGNLTGIPANKVLLQETSARAWDEIKISLLVGALFKQTERGDIKSHSVTVKVTVFDSTGTTEIASKTETINGKTSTQYKRLVPIEIPEDHKSDDGYRFTVEKTSDEENNSRVNNEVSAIGWFEIENTPQTYPRSALIGYALKAVNEHSGGVPTLSSLVKGLIVKVPSNYNQPILTDGQIDWREVELPESGTNGYTTNGYSLQKSGTSTKLTSANPQIYVGTWDGSFVYSWTQNPVWIIYDILTNTQYGLGIPEDNIDKYKFYQVAQYCDACDSVSGEFQGVTGQADGSFRHKPRGKFTTVRKTLEGIPIGTQVQERRFIIDTVVADQGQAMDTLNSIAASFRGTLVHSFGKISLAVDMPDQLPVMVFNETNIKSGSFQISGGRESDIITGVDVSYIEPTNHYKREVVRIDTIDSNDGNDRSSIENIASLDLAGVTRRSQALRFAQYQIAASRYLRRLVAFTTSTEALSLAPGDIISVSQNMTGINYGFGGKVSANSSTATDKANVLLEHFTQPTLANSTFTANTNPLALRIIKTDSERVDLYIVDNAAFTLSAEDVSSGFDLANVSVVARYNPITKSLDDFTTFTANNVPSKGDLWSFGEWENPGNFYTNKAGKLFSVVEIERETKDEEINIVAKEYVSNVYVDSDDFIDYTPTAYTDIESGFSQPPIPLIDLKKVPRRKADGSVVTDVVIENNTDRRDYQQSFSTEYFLSTPDSTTLVNNSNGTVLTLTVDNSSALANNALSSTLTGKNGFTTFAGEIKLLCNSLTTVDNGDGTSNVRLTVEGLNVAHDLNFSKHVLEVNDGSFLGLKGFDQVSVPLRQKSSISSAKNFVAFNPDIVAVSSNIVAFDKSNDTLDIENNNDDGSLLTDVLPPTPFYVSINQLLDSRFYANNSFYVLGTEKEIVLQNTFTGSAGSVETINLPHRVRDKNFLRLFVDGIEKSKGQFTLNKNSDVRDNVEYLVQSSESEYRLEFDHYTVPSIEVGDNIATGAGNAFAVINTSFDPTSAGYNVQLTTNSIFRIELEQSPTSNLAAVALVNISPNPVGTVNNVSSNTCTFDYDTTVYPGSFKLANSGVYDLQVSADYERIFLTDDLVLPDVQPGVTSVRARNINSNKRTSPTAEKRVLVSPIPIRKVRNLDVVESLYREQNSGVAVRATLSFDHITDQEVTDYEISYKFNAIEDVGGNDGGTDLTSFNTVKVPSAGVDGDGKIRFTVNAVNRGNTSGINSILFRVTPLNKEIRGVPTNISKTILGKTAKPANVYNFRGAQSSDQITLFWEYERINDELADLDLKEVVIRRLQGTNDLDLENFIAAVPLLTVAGAEQRITIPIDIYGTFTYLVRTRDTSGNFSDGTTGIVITTVRPKNTNVVAAFSEDDPGVDFTDIPNANSDEFRFPSFANSNSGGLSHSYTSLVDNANGTSSGFSAVAGAPTDLLADSTSEYITQIRDYGSEVSAVLNIDIEGTQAIQSTFNDQMETITDSVTEEAPNNTVLVDSSFGGIGHIIGFNNTESLDFRFDANNETRVSGGINGNVYAIEMVGNFTDDESNANVLALIAGPINANAVALGETFFANGVSTGSNSMANLAVAGSSYHLVDLKQFNDFGAAETFQGDIGALTTQTLIRTSTADSVFYANGNVNVTAFEGHAVNEGFVAYEAGSRTLRHFQIKFIVNNSEPDEYDFTIDKFRYTIEKVRSQFSTVVTYDETPKSVDFSSENFRFTPNVSFQVIEAASAQTAVVPSISNSTLTFRLWDNEAGALVPTNQSVKVQITADGV